LALAFIGEKPPDAVKGARELFARFDATGRVTELRARYPNSAGASAAVSKLLDELKKKAGAPAVLPAPWTSLWPELPAQQVAPTLHRWQDDQTLLTCQRDAFGTEVTLRDCPPEHETGITLPPLEYLPRGPEGCVLSVRRDELLRQWGVRDPVRAG